MPTTRSLRAGGYDDQKLGTGEKFCYVCGEIVTGFCQKDEPRKQAIEGPDGQVLPPALSGTEQGHRRRDCSASEFAGETKQAMLAWRMDQLAEE